MPEEPPDNFLDTLPPDTQSAIVLVTGETYRVMTAALFKDLELRVKRLEEEVDQLQIELAALAVTVGQLRTEVTALQSDVDQLQIDVVAAQKRADDAMDYSVSVWNNLHPRVSSLEKRVTALERG